LLFNHTQITASNAQRVADIVALGQQNGMLGGSAFRFLTNPANSNTAVERVRIDPNGNVGIGTTAPANKLSVSGSANFTGNVGIGTTTPASALQVTGGIVSTLN